MKKPEIEAAAMLIDRPRSFEEMRERQAFTAPLDHKQHGLKEVLTSYYFEREVPCGLAACRQGHKSGFLVLTESGAETNIGHKCGRSHFGAEVFAMAKDTYDKLRERADLVKVAKELQERTPGICSRIEEVAFGQPYGVRWLTTLRKDLYRLIGPMLDSLEQRERRHDYAVTQERARSEKEIENLMAANRGISRAMARYERVPVGSLRPMPWITFDLRRRLVVEIQGPLEAFAVIDAAQEPSPSLKSRLKAFEGIDRVLQEADSACSSAVDFLADENLSLVALCIPDFQRAAADSLRKWIGSSDHRKLMRGAERISAPDADSA